MSGIASLPPQLRELRDADYPRFSPQEMARRLVGAQLGRVGLHGHEREPYWPSWPLVPAIYIFACYQLSPSP